MPVREINATSVMNALRPVTACKKTRRIISTPTMVSLKIKFATFLRAVRALPKECDVSERGVAVP